ncbi:hypothetical protein [Leptolyngbya ohadii]|nr:hypothetical protein [Leptolyngbya ohadii]
MGIAFSTLAIDQATGQISGQKFQGKIAQCSFYRLRRTGKVSLQ